MSGKVRIGRKEVIDLLLKKNANPNLPNQLGTTPFHLAVHNSRPEIVEALLAAGADVNAVDRRGKNALFYVFNESPQTLKIVTDLLRRKIDPNRAAPGEESETPVHHAAKTGQFETLKLLIQNGGDPTQKTKDGKTPLELAKQYLLENGIIFGISTKWRKVEKEDLEKIVHFLEHLPVHFPH